MRYLMRAGSPSATRAEDESGAANPKLKYSPVATDPEKLEHAILADKTEGLRMLLETLAAGPANPELIRLVRTHFAGSGSEELRDALLAQLPRTQDYRAQIDFIDTIRGVDDSNATRDRLRALAENQQMDLYHTRGYKWAIDELTFDNAVEEFVSAGLLEPPTSETLAKIRNDWGLDEGSNESPMLFVYLLETTQMVSFEAYKPSKSIWYDELLPYVFGNLEPPKVVEDVEVDTNEDRRVVAISWTMDGERISEPYDSEEPLDVVWFIAMTNRHLAALGSSKRCLSPEFNDDRVNLWVAEPDSLWPLLRKYHVAYNNSHYYQDSLRV